MNDFQVLDIETSASMPWDGELVAVGLGTEVLKPDEGRQSTRRAMLSDAPLVCHTNYDLRWMLLDGGELGDDVHFHDTKVMAWMLDASQELALDALAARYLGYTPPKLISKSGGVIYFDSKIAGGKVRIEEAPWSDMEAYNRSDIETTAELYVTLRTLLQEQGLWDYFLEEEAPFSRLLVEMEQEGLPFNKEKCAEMHARAVVKRDALRVALVDQVGDPDFNPGSPDQLARYLYDDTFTAKAKIEIPRLTGMTAERKLAAVQSIAPAGVIIDKVGRDYAYGKRVLDGRGLRAPKLDKYAKTDRPTTNAKTLAVMHGDDPWVSQYLEWKKLQTLTGTFLEKWMEREHNGKLHGRFDQSGTGTGRLSNKEPNLQQVPTSQEWNVRELFEGDLVVGDYSGLEVRLSAHFSHDPLMMDVFNEDRDLYGVIASEAWGGPPDKTNPYRTLAKVIMLSSQYGAQDEKLQAILAIAGMRYTVREAGKFLRDLEHQLPRLFQWRQEVIEEARALGYVSTLAGRRRHLPDMNSPVWRQMAKAERQAVNSKVQGSAADVVRRAMLAAHRAVDPAEAIMILQVHDEILWRRGPEWSASTFQRLQHACEHGTGFELDVPLIFEAKIAQSWAEKKGSAGQVEVGAYAAVGLEEVA